MTNESSRAKRPERKKVTLQRRPVESGTFGRSAPEDAAPSQPDTSAVDLDNPPPETNAAATQHPPGHNDAKSQTAVAPTSTSTEQTPAALNTSKPQTTLDSPPKAVATRTQRTKKKTSHGWALSAVLDSNASARKKRDQWEFFGVRYDQVVKSELEDRLATHQQQWPHRRLALNHYVSAALSQIPDSVDEAVGWAHHYEDLLDFNVVDNQGTRMRIEGSVAQRLTLLHPRVRQRARFGLFGPLQNWAIIRFIAGLDSNDPGTGPEYHRALDALTKSIESQLQKVEP